VPEVSIIIPVYNTEKYFEKCMESVLAQKERDFEVILVDDGSTDRSGALCDFYAEKDDRVSVLHKNNAGPAAARNSGLSCAAGKYLCFVDSDDYLSKDYLEKSLAAARQYDADIVIFDYDAVDETGSAILHYHAGLDHGRVLTLETCPALLNTSPSPCNKLYKKQHLDRLQTRFPEGRLYEDLAVMPTLYYNASAVYIDAGALYFYVVHKGSIMRMTVPDSQKRYEDRIFAVNCIKEFYTGAGMDEMLKENLEFLAIYHIYFMLSIETIAEDPKNEYLQKYGEYIRREYPAYKKNRLIPILFTKKERIKFRLLNGRHYKMIALLGKVKGVLH